MMVESYWKNRKQDYIKIFKNLKDWLNEYPFLIVFPVLSLLIYVPSFFIVNSFFINSNGTVQPIGLMILFACLPGLFFSSLEISNYIEFRKGV